MKQTTRRNVAAMLTALMLTGVLAGALTGCGAGKKGTLTSAAQLNDSAYTVGISQGAAGQKVVEEEFPKAQKKYYTTDVDAYLGVQQGKIDAFVYDRVSMQFAIANGLTGVELLPDSIGPAIEIAMGISPKSKIPDLQQQFNTFLAEIRADGKLDDMLNRWINEADDTMPEIAAPENPQQTIRIGTTGLVQPFSYYEGDQLTGYDIEMIRRFALWMNADVEITTYNYDGIVAAAQGGTIDCILANLNITEERKESIAFSDVIYESHNGVMVQSTGTKTSATGETTAAAERIAPEQARIGVMEGSTNEVYAETHYPDADRQSFKNYVDSCAALSAGKLDYAMMDYTNALRFTRSNPELEIVSDFLTDEKLCFGVTKKNPELHAKVSEVVDRFLADGTVDAAISHWIKPDGSAYENVETPKLPDAPKLKVAIVSSREPTTFVLDGEYAGLDIELIDRILYELGYQADYMDMEWGAVISAIESNKADMVLGMYNTPERAEKLLFTAPYFNNPQLLVACKTQETEALGEYTTLAQLAGKQLSCLSGSIFDKLVEKKIPDVHFSYFNNSSDELAALRGGKVEAVSSDEPVAKMFVAQNDDLALLPEKVEDDHYGMTLVKGSPLTAEFNREIKRLREDGTIDTIFEKWLNADENTKLPVLEGDTPNGTLKVACAVALAPMCYSGPQGTPVGFDVELLMYIAQALGKKVEFISVDFGGLIPMVQSGKADVAIGCMSITEERKQTVDMTDSYHDGGIMFVVRKADTSGVAQVGFWEGLKASFTRTFITENRWKLVVDGLLVTVVLSVCAGVLGSVVGFGICMLRRSKRRLASLPAAALIRIVQGTPIVVLLMILYYIVFGQMDISGIFVAVLGFALNFGVYVSEMIRTGIDAVDVGQIEAAHALGFTKMRTFWKITFPQAARHFLPVFKGEFVSMVKMTSVVGYIAIQDLTKVSDIIRSRTLEAFFPLIATAVLYFIVANLLTMLLTRLEISLDPKRRKREVKGVVTQ